MFASGTESIFVSDVVDGVPDVSLRVNVTEATSNSKCFVLSSSVYNLRAFLVLLLLTIVACAIAAPQVNPNEITIIKQEESNNIGVGGYHFSYEQSDGQKREETAELKNEGTDDESLDVTGSFSFTSPDGHTYRVDYTADKDGFHPTINLVSK